MAGAVLALLLVGVGVGIYFAGQEHDRWVQWCVSEGGHVDSSTSTGVGIDYTNGKPVTTTSTTFYCLTSDGRVLDVTG